nr:nuclear apoptosis-inducing factor 1-like [Misgurnus anguillicaudatus]
MAKKAKKRNFTDTEMEVLVNEVESNQHILFGSLSAGGITNKRKHSVWEHVTSAVNSVGSEERTVPEIKKKWFDIKLSAKKRVTAHRREISATGGGQTTTEISPLDSRVASIIGDTALSGIIRDGDTDALEQAGPSHTQTQVTPMVTEELDEPVEVVEAGPSVAPSVRRPPRVLTDAVLQNQEDTTKAINDIKEQLSNITSVLLQINESLKQIASCANKMTNNP